MKKIILNILLLFGLVSASAQKAPYTHADSLKGSIGPYRSWWDVQHYDLDVRFNIADSSISGKNKITYKVLNPMNKMQLDLMKPMEIDSIIHYSQRCTFTRDGNAFFVDLPAEQLKDVSNEVTVYFHGRPKVAKMPPWDGGVVWSKDKNGAPWISIACQGMAAQVWFPNKDHMYDEPDGCTIRVTAPSSLVTVSNGKLVSTESAGEGMTAFKWEVKNPINNYCIIPYIGKYSNFKDTLKGEGGILELDYWVLDYNLEKARRQFVQAKSMLRCFEYWFGKYPFYEDGYKLVEAPFLGMEHQSAIAYGNDYVNGYRGRDLSLSGWGLRWDFIIVHESGHEWFGNNISAADVADNWIHESFTAYAENLYTEYLYGKKAGAAYVIGTRGSVMNDKPVISDYNVNAGGSIDLYYKGANMLHTIRQLVHNDSLWRAMLRGLNSTFYHQTVGTKQIEDYMSQFLGMNLSKIFDQYLRTTNIPVLEYRRTKSGIDYRWTRTVKGFDLSLPLSSGGRTLVLHPTEKWQKMELPDKSFSVDENYYVNISEVIKK